ncbi:MAG: O-acetyl-ADP-ribose deacetylase [Ketobacteraceae bacterium]|nr:O-acetyl-ADP-ribose deacetylase [Ketobacteraceae bacterium]
MTEDEKFHAEVIAWKGDITQLQVDAIVNAANSSLAGGGGVDGAIHRAAGPELLEACQKIGGCPPGKAVITDGFQLPAKFVIHTVGPVWRGGDCDEDEVLANCYINSLKVAATKVCRSIAFSAISTGVYGFPKEQAVAIAVREVYRQLPHYPFLDHVVFCCFDDAMLDLYEHELEKYSSPDSA